MPSRSRKEEKKYVQYQKHEPKSTSCVFCDFDNTDDQFIKETKSFKIVKNRFGYSYWDNQGVLDHLMLIPKKHTDTFNDFTSLEAIEYVDLLGSYESQGYDIASRAPSSNRKTVAHQHTHLIKLDQKSKSLIIYLKKPLVRLTIS